MAGGKAGRPRKGQDLQERLDKYLREYELDDLNGANDYASLVQMCRLEVYIEKLQASLDGMKDLSTDTKKVKDLNTALKDSIQAYLNLQDKLGINRSQRVSENDETPLSYIEKLRDQAKRFLDLRFKVVKCPSCSTNLAKYYIYVNEKGEEGSLASAGKPVEHLKHKFTVECPRCGAFAVEGNINEGEI
jgi:rubredoxin